MSGFPAGTAAAEGLACCHVCFKVALEALGRCPRCRARLHLREPNSLQRALALVATASLLYIPANVLPIMTTEQLGRAMDSTILGGVVVLIHHGDYPIAGVIFIASVLVPLSKLIALSWLCWTVSRGQPSSHHERARLYRAAELVGKWSMTDVFVVAILVALIHLTGLLVIRPGTAALAFGGVVIVTMLAAHAFDPRLIWDQIGDSND
jgi:paraquat-inducible protein A